MNRDLLLWTPILTSPAVWFLTLTVNFALAPLPCGGAGDIARRAVSVIALLITGAAGALALALWKRNRSGELRAEGAPIERVRAMTIAGVVLSAGFFLVIVAQALPDFILAGCK